MGFVDLIRRKTKRERVLAAIKANDIDKLPKLLASDQRINIQNENGQSLLEIACENGFEQSVRYLISRRENWGQSGCASFRISIEKGKENVVRILAKKLIDTLPLIDTHLELILNPGYRENVSVVHYAAAKGTPSVLKEILMESNFKEVLNENDRRVGATPSGLDPAHIAAMFGRTDIIDEMLDQGVDLNARERRSGQTPLHLAVYYKRHTTVNRLLEALVKTDIEDTTIEKHTPLSLARSMDLHSIVQLLEKHTRASNMEIAFISINEMIRNEKAEREKNTNEMKNSIYENATEIERMKREFDERIMRLEQKDQDCSEIERPCPSSQPRTLPQGVSPVMPEASLTRYVYRSSSSVPDSSYFQDLIGPSSVTDPLGMFVSLFDRVLPNE